MSLHITPAAAAVTVMLDAQAAVPIPVFLDTLGARFRMEWFVFQGALYASLASEGVRAGLEVGSGRQADLRAYLEGIHLFDDRFVWLPLSGSDRVVVEGPPEYVRLVRLQAQRLQAMAGAVGGPASTAATPPSENLTTMVFRLRYASAADLGSRELESQSNAMRPGVASVVGAMMGQSTTRPSVPRLAEEAGDRMAALRQGGTLLDAPGSSPLGPAVLSQERVRAYADAAVELGTTSSRVTADARTNSVLVRDRAELRDQYAEIIAALDVPVPLISLDVLAIELPLTTLQRCVGMFVNGPPDQGVASPEPLPASFLNPKAQCPEGAESTARALLARVATADRIPRVLPQSEAQALVLGIGALRHVDRRVDMASHATVFQENTDFALDFRDARVYPRYSVPIWDALLRSLFRLPEGQDQLEASMELKLRGTGRLQADGRIGLQFAATESRRDPDLDEKYLDHRQTVLRAAAELTPGDTLVMVASAYAHGHDAERAPRLRLILMSARPQTALAQEQP